MEPSHRRRLRPGFILALIIGGVILGWSLLAAAMTGGNGGGSTDLSTPTAPIAHHASPKPTTPTPTPKPMSIADQAKTIATSATLIGQNITTAFENGSLTVSEFLDTNAQLNNGTIIFSIKQDCFSIQQALWQAHLKGVTAIELDITAPLQDQYGNAHNGPLALCLLTDVTAARFNWGNLAADQAWQDYDAASYLPSLNQ